MYGDALIFTYHNISFVSPETVRNHCQVERPVYHTVEIPLIHHQLFPETEVMIH